MCSGSKPTRHSFMVKPLWMLSSERWASLPRRQGDIVPLAVHQAKVELVGRRRATRCAGPRRLAHDKGGSNAHLFVVEPGNSEASVRFSDTQKVSVSPTDISVNFSSLPFTWTP
jgi:hypothetical protein